MHQVQHDGDAARVSGIVNDGHVPVNGEFVSMRSEAGTTAPIALRVSSIVTYRKLVAELPKGMSGELHVCGDGVSRLEAHCLLMG